MPRRKGARRALAKLIYWFQYQSKLRPEHSLAGVFRSRLPPDSIRPNHQRLANPGPKRRGLLAFRAAVLQSAQCAAILR